MNLKTNKMKFLNDQIKTKKDIAYYITDLYDNNMLYHFDDDAQDVLSFTSNFESRAFTDEQYKLLNKRRDEMFAIDYDYAFECALALLED
jgi:hypothetical protein